MYESEGLRNYQPENNSPQESKLVMTIEQDLVIWWHTWPQSKENWGPLQHVTQSRENWGPLPHNWSEPQRLQHSHPKQSWETGPSSFLPGRNWAQRKQLSNIPVEIVDWCYLRIKREGTEKKNVFTIGSDRKYGLGRQWKLRSVRADEFRKSAGHSQIKEIKKPSLRWEYTSYEIWYKIGTRRQ